MDDFAPKTICALVTGGAKRLGQSMVRYLAGRGYDVAIHCNHSVDEALLFSSELKQKFADGRIFPVVRHDLADWQNIGHLLDGLPNGFGPLAILVNNASSFRPASLLQTSSQGLHDNFAVHLFSPLMLMNEFHRRYGCGCIVNMLDTKVVTNQNTHAAYLLSKKSLAHLTTMSALEFAPTIRVNAIAPGPVLPAIGANANTFSLAVDATPLGEPVALDEINAALGYLLDSPHVTGQILFLDSGSHLNGLSF